MKTKLLIATSAAGAFAVPAFAQDSTESFDVEASVPATCLMEDISNVDLGEIDIVRSSGADALSIESTSTARTDDFYISCNTNAEVTLTTLHGGLLNTSRGAPTAAEAADGFTNIIEYNARLDNFFAGQPNSAQPKLTTRDEGPGGQDGPFSTGALHHQVHAQITVLPAQNSGLPLAGDYYDQVTINITTI